MAEHTLQDHRILVIEDEYLLAMALQGKLQDLGAVVLGPVGNLDDALALIQSEAWIDGAVLDINLGGKKAFPAADLLTERGIPFVFTTGYDDLIIPERFGNAPRLQKPADISTIVQALAGVS
ncbi:response regulator [Paracoccus acridae]|uniref:Response regulator n=1 Tax=Paracoccus acridae TaxID=1795310 RepID=A0ABQ1VLC0_9RHOB|nr:response regulator [Paracoccus acridae]GGF77697.1 response regulator [Paracoccus acridae]